MSLDLLRAIDELPEISVLVVGDAILDRYIAGPVDRISPEGPIPILRQEVAEETCGGMAAVACNLVRLGARVRVAGLVGKDDGGVIVNGAAGDGLTLGLQGFQVAQC